MRPKISVVVPVYNREAYLRDDIIQLREVLSGLFPSFELLIIDDGSSDNTRAIASALHGIGEIRFFHNGEHKGKGAALRRGTRESTGEIICYLDSDLSIDPKYLPILIAALEKGADAAIASRFIPGGKGHATLLRSISSHIFRLLRKIIIGLPDIADTQCGCKAFKREPLLAAVEKSVIHGFTYDVELLLSMKQKGHQVVEVPVVILPQHGGKSSVKIFKQAFIMTKDLLTIRKHHGTY
jgi:glycosyltransferase involved in cell wall biosynthesis